MSIHLDDAPQRVLDALDRLCRAGEQVVTRSVPKGSSGYVQTGTAEMLLDWRLAKVSQQARPSRGQARTVVPTTAGRLLFDNH